MPLWLACLLLMLDVAALVVLPKKLREKRGARIAVTCVCVLIALALVGYLALTAIFLDAAYHK